MRRSAKSSVDDAFRGAKERPRTAVVSEGRGKTSLLQEDCGTCVCLCVCVLGYARMLLFESHSRHPTSAMSKSSWRRRLGTGSGSPTGLHFGESAACLSDDLGGYAQPSTKHWHSVRAPTQTHDPILRFRDQLATAFDLLREISAEEIGVQ